MDPIVERQRSIDVDAAPDERVADAHRTRRAGDVVRAARPSSTSQPGGRGRFVDDDGIVRRAVVDQRATGRAAGAALVAGGRRPGAGASVVTFVVAPDAGGAAAWS